MSKIEEKRKKKIISPNGSVDPERYIFIDPSVWNKDILIPKIELKQFITLLAPSQSGKTTRARVLVQQLKEKGYFPLL